MTQFDVERPGQNQQGSAPECGQPENERARFIEAKEQFGETLEEKPTSHGSSENTV